MSRSITFTCLATAAVLGCAGSAFGQIRTFPRYELIELGTLGGDESAALGMNDAGMVVGWSETGAPDYGMEAFVWHDGRISGLGTLGGPWSQAMAVNNRGLIVGRSASDRGEVRAFVYAAGRMHDLTGLVVSNRKAGVFSTRGTWPSGRATGRFTTLFEANSISDDGRIVGCGFVYGTDDIHAYILTPVGGDPTRLAYTIEDLGTLPGATDCIAYDVSPSDEVCGVSGGEGFIWRNGIMEPLDNFTRTVVYESEGLAINADGTIVGWYTEGGNMPHRGCLWRGGQRFNLGWEAGWETEAVDLNDYEQVVGWASDENRRIAVMWEGCFIVDLNRITAVPVQLAGPGSEPRFAWGHLEEATAVNELGFIAGYGRGSQDHQRAFLLVPIDNEDQH